MNDVDLAVSPGKARLQIGYMAQKFSLYGSLSVKENLSFFAGIYNLTDGKKTEAMEEMIKIFSLQDFLETVSAEPAAGVQTASLACLRKYARSSGDLSG